MKRPSFSFRPNLAKEAQRTAWDILQGVSSGQKNHFIAQAILQNIKDDSLEIMLRRIVREELSCLSITQPNEVVTKDEIPEQILNFVGSLFVDE